MAEHPFHVVTWTRQSPRRRPLLVRITEWRKRRHKDLQFFPNITGACNPMTVALKAPCTPAAPLCVTECVHIGWDKPWPHFSPHPSLAESVRAPVSWNCPSFSRAWADAFHTHWSRARGGVYSVLSPRGVYLGRRGAARHCLGSNTRRKTLRETAGGVKVEVCPVSEVGGATRLAP